VSVEGFSEKDAAHILEVTEAELKALVDDAGREMASQIAANVLIIEDEMLIAMDLEQVVARLGHRVIGIARKRSDALARAREDNRALSWRIFDWPTEAPDWTLSTICSIPSKFL
jgi:hypothetical protein